MTQSTQTQHPWRATLRTVAAVVLALLPVLPQLVDDLGLSAYGWAATVVAIAGGITRILAYPRVNALLARYFPALAAAGRGEKAAVYVYGPDGSTAWEGRLEDPGRGD